MKRKKIWIEQLIEHGLVNLSRFCRFVSTMEGQYDENAFFDRHICKSG
jgi:dTDP-4-dehydrorhamnose 3,5-epimerase-like enzyme